MPRARGIAAYARDEYGAFRQNKLKHGCCKMLVFFVCGAIENFYIFSLYRNPDLDDQIYVCLLKALAAVQATDVSVSLIIMGDLNGHHQE